MAFNFETGTKEADRRLKQQGIKSEPFEIQLPDGESIYVDYPDAEVSLMLSQLDKDDVVGQLRTLFNNRQSDFRKLIDAVRGKPYTIMQVLIEEMYKFWNNDSREIPGKSKR